MEPNKAAEPSETLKSNKAYLIIKYQECIDNLEITKESLYFKKECRNNAGYDFQKITALSYIFNIKQDIINKKGKSLKEAIEFFVKNWESMIDGFIEVYKKKIEEL